MRAGERGEDLCNHCRSNIRLRESTYDFVDELINSFIVIHLLSGNQEGRDIE